MLSLTEHGKPCTVEQWITGMADCDKESLLSALMPNGKPASEKSGTLEACRVAFHNLSSCDRLTFMDELAEGRKIAEDAIFEGEIDSAIQAELDKRRGA